SQGPKCARHSGFLDPLQAMVGRLGSGSERSVNAGSRKMADKARKAEVIRETKETKIKVSVDVDGSGKSTVSTGVGFFDHMLESFAKHSAMDINVDCKGDLHIDQHHTMEDVGIVLGQAFKQAVGSYSGVIRFGHAYIPMDETLARASIDLCN